MSGLRSLLWRTLLDAGVLIDDARFDRVRLEAAASARRHLPGIVHSLCAREPADVAAAVGLSPGAIARVSGHGWQQAAGFAAYAGVRPGRVEAVARLGTLLSLGIVLFDHVLDTQPEQRAALVERLDPQRLRTQPDEVRAPRGDLALDFLGALAVEVVSGAERLDGRPEEGARFAQLLEQMYRGERASVEARRDGAPTPEVWEALRGKSALPASAVSVLALLANPSASDETREIVERAAALVGEAFWIVDDLADVEADWDAGCWSRSLFLLLERPEDAPVSGEDAVRRLLDSGIAAAEALRLSRVLTELAALPAASDRALLRPIQAAVRSWVEEIPGAASD